MAKPNLKDLPEELVSNIALRLWSDDIQALRLTCKDLEAKTLHDFATEYFSEKGVIISTDSLKTLVAIASSEKFRGFLHRIHIITAYFSESAFTCGRHCPYGHCCGWQPTVRQREAWKWLVQDAKDLKASGKDREMLTEIFGRLPALHYISIVDTTDAIPLDVDIRGMRKVARLCGRSFQIPSETKVDPEYLKILSHIWSILTSSIANSHKTTLRCLATGLAKGNNSLCMPLDVRWSDVKLSMMKTALQNVNALSLRFTTRMRRGGLAEEKQGATLQAIPQRAQKFASIFTALDSLILDFDGAGTDQVVFTNLMKGLDLSGLKKLTINTMKTDRKSLMAVLDRLPAMQELFLSFVDLARGSWIPVLKQLQGMSDRLDHLHLMYLSENSKKAYFLSQPDEDELQEQDGMFFDDLMGGPEQDDFSDEDTDEDLPPLEAMEVDGSNAAPGQLPLPAFAGANQAPAPDASSSTSAPLPTSTSEPTKPKTSKADDPDAHASADFKAPGNEGYPERGYYICIRGKEEINKRLKIFVQEYNLGEYLDAQGPGGLMMGGGPMGGGPMGGGPMGGAMTIPVPVGNGPGQPANMNNFLNGLAGALGLPYPGPGAAVAPPPGTTFAGGGAANTTAQPNAGHLAPAPGVTSAGGGAFGAFGPPPPPGAAGAPTVGGAEMDDGWDTAESSEFESDTQG